jgi:polysaccharide export outer membrane protein
MAKAIKLSEGRMSFSPKTLTTVIDTKRLVSGEAPELNMLVESGDVVHVPYAGNAYVLGGVKKPGNVTVKENLTLSQAIAMAGGVDPLLGISKVIIMRFDKQGRPLRIETDLKKIQSGNESDMPVLDNDAIVVQESETKKKLWVIRQILPVPSGGYAIPTQ